MTATEHDADKLSCLPVPSATSIDLDDLAFNYLVSIL
jgi:hypothetical protein